MKKEDLINKKLVRVEKESSGKAIRFYVEGQSEAIYAFCERDCCSNTWIEDVESPIHVIGCKVISIEDIDFEQKTGWYDDELVQFYGCKINTEGGSFLIEFRNSSNGFYGGWLEWEFSNLTKPKSFLKVLKDLEWVEIK